MKIFPKLITVLGAALSIFSASFSQDVSTYSNPVPNTLLIKFASNLKESTKQTLIKHFGGRQTKHIAGPDIRVVKFAETNVAAKAAAIKKKAGVVFAEEDRYVKGDFINPFLIPNDSRISEQWHLPKIKAFDAWDITTGDESVIIAICDSGCDPTHPDLINKYVAGYNFYDNNTNTADVNGHGTAVAGVAAAHTNNAASVAGVGFNCKIMPVRVADSTGYALYSNMAAGITYAADNGAKVVNLSYNGRSSAAVSSAAQYLRTQGGVFFISAGNGNSLHTQADNPYEIQVAATEYSDLRASFSDYGPDVDLCAPGQNIVTTTMSVYLVGSGTGTSFSTPIVAGIAGLIFSVNPALTPAQVEQILKDSADDLGDIGWDQYFGYGRVNAYNAVLLAGEAPPGDTSAPSVTFNNPTNGSTVSGTNVSISINAVDNVGLQSGGTLKIDGTVVKTFTTTAPFTFNWNTLSYSNGSHTLTATFTDTSSNQAITTISVSVNNPTDTIAPTVKINSPKNGSTVKPTTPVKVNVTDNIGVVLVKLYVDGVYTMQSSTSPFTNAWNTSGVSSGNHTLVCKAYDAAGNEGVSQTITVKK